MTETEPKSGRWTRKRPAGVATLIGGTAAGQLVALVMAPVLARIYTTDEFGLFAVVFGIALILGSVSALRFELAIVLPDRAEDGFSVAWLALSFVVLSSLSAAGVMILFAQAFADGLGRGNSTPFLLAVPLLSLLIGCFSVLNQLAIRARRFGSIAQRNFLQQASGSLAQTTFGLLSWTSWGLIIGQSVGQGVGVISLAARSGLRSGPARTGCSLIRMRQMFTRYRRFPLFLTPAALLNNLGQQAPVLLIALFYGAVPAGLMGLTQRVLAVPVSVIGLAVAQVYLSSIARAAGGAPSQCQHLFYRTSARLASVALPAAGLLAVGAPWAFGTMFGADWYEAGEFAKVLAPLFALQLIASPVSQTLIVFERVVAQLLWDAIRVLALAIPVAFCALTGLTVLTAVAMLSLVGTLMYAGLWLLCWRTVARVRPLTPQKPWSDGADLRTRQATDDNQASP